jgi:hypothetical protein
MFSRRDLLKYGPAGAFALRGLLSPKLANAATTYLIIDTDMADDCDDCSDVAAMMGIAAAGTWIPLGLIISSLNEYSPICADAITRHCGYNISSNIGVNMTGAPTGDQSSVYTQQVASRFLPGNTYGQYGDGVATYRRLLAGAPNGSVVIVSIGFAAVLAALLQSSADGYSSLNGVQLVTAKVSLLTMASGYMPNSNSQGPEGNMSNDPVNFAYVASNWPTPLVFGGIEMATYSCGPNPAADPTIDPVKYAYNLTSVTLRPAYSQGAVFYAAYGLGSNYSWGGQNGTLTVNTSTGADSWASTPTGNVSYLTKSASDATLLAAYNNLIRSNGLPAKFISNGNLVNGFIK